MNINTALILLKEARHSIDTGDQLYICIALEDAEDKFHEAGNELPDGSATVSHLCAYISHEIFGYAYFGMWLAAQLGVYQLQEGLKALARMAWIDRITLELETKGRLP